MRKFVLYAVAMLAFVALTALNSCVKQDTLSDGVVEVSFSISNPSLDFSKKGGDDGSNQDYPICSDATARYASVKISQNGVEIGGSPFILDVLNNFEDGNQTTVIQLDAGTYTVESFMVFDNDGTALWAMPKEDSQYDNTYNLNTPENEESTGQLYFTFDTEKFRKRKVNVDVLCFQPYQYDDFGFNWFDFRKIKIKTLCFFGDICTESYVEWHQSGPYADQPYDGYDFPAIFEVKIIDADGNQVNDPAFSSNLYNPDGSYWGGTGAPLCIEYPDYVGQDDPYTAQIYVYLPDGEKRLAEEIPFNAEDDTELVTGDNGVYEFVFGDLCGDDVVVIDDPGNDTGDGTETAFAKFPKTDDSGMGYIFATRDNCNPEDYNSLGTSNCRWGWAGKINADITVPVYAGAAQNKISKGFYAGDVEYDFIEGTNELTITFTAAEGLGATEFQLYVEDYSPDDIAPGQYTINGISGVFDSYSELQTSFSTTVTYNDADNDGIWLIFHTVVK